MLILGIIILVVGTAVVVITPLTQKDMSAEEPAYVDLTLVGFEEEKESAYNAIKEAEFDFETGKLSDEDFQTIKNKYSAKAVAAIKNLEAHQKELAGNRQSTVDKDVQQASGQRVTVAKANYCSSCGAKIQKDAKFCGSCGQAQTKVKANTCPNCGSEHKKGDKFCKSCGRKI